MYELIVYDKKKSYILIGESPNPKDYPTIPVGASVFVLDTQRVFSKIGPSDMNLVDFEDEDVPDEPSTEPEINTTSVLGEAIIGEMNIGE